FCLPLETSQMGALARQAWATNISVSAARIFFIMALHGYQNNGHQRSSAQQRIVEQQQRYKKRPGQTVTRCPTTLHISAVPVRNSPQHRLICSMKSGGQGSEKFIPLSA